MAERPHGMRSVLGNRADKRRLLTIGASSIHHRQLHNGLDQNDR